MAGGLIIAFLFHHKLESVRLFLPYVLNPISCGFPSPALDFAEDRIDLATELVRNESATFYMRAIGDSMKGEGIYTGDILVVDRSISPKDGSVIVAAINGDFAVKRFRAEGGKIWLESANAKYPSIYFRDLEELDVFGVVTYSIHSLHGKGNRLS